MAGAAATTAFLGRPDGIGIAPAHAMPFPSANVELDRIDDPFLWRRACGSDQWPHIAIDGSSILAGWGDGFGWQLGGAKAYLGYTRISGSVTSPNGNDGFLDTQDSSIRQQQFKPCSFIRWGDSMYAYVTGDVDDRDGTRLLRGPIQGNDMVDTGSVVMRRSVHGLQVVGAVHHEIGDNRERIILVAERGNDRDVYRRTYNQKVWAARVSPSNVDDVDNWEWYCGAADGERYWARGRVRDGRFDLDGNRAVEPILDDPVGCGKHVMITWCPSLDGYVMSKTHQRNNLALFYSRYWDGPYRTLFYGDFVPGGGDATIFTAQVVQMWSGGDTLALLWSGFSNGQGSCQDKGSTNYDAVHLTRFRVRR